MNILITIIITFLLILPLVISIMFWEKSDSLKNKIGRIILNYVVFGIFYGIGLIQALL